MTVHQVPVLSQYEWQKAIKQILSSPPGSPNKGDRYIVGPSPTGVWSDHAGKIATYIDSWDFLSPFKGMIVYNINTDELIQYGVNNRWEGLRRRGRDHVEEVPAGKSLTINDIGSTFTANSTGSSTFYLPSVDNTHIGASFRFVKLGSGTLTIVAADQDRIADSGVGDTIYDAESTETFATISLFLASEEQWVIIEGHGTWTTTD